MNTQSKESLLEDALARLLRAAYDEASELDAIDGGSKNFDRVTDDESVLRAELFGGPDGGAGK